MARPATVIRLNAEEEETLRLWVRGHKSERRMVERARIVLLAAAATSTAEIARQLGSPAARVSKWRTRFAQQRLAGLCDQARSGRPARYDQATRKRILCQLDEAPPEGHATWTGELLAEALGDVSKHQVWRVLRQLGVSLRRRRSWCLSTDRSSLARPPHCRTLPQPAGKRRGARGRREAEHPGLGASAGLATLAQRQGLDGLLARLGTTTLFAALEVATGFIIAGHYWRRRRREFLDFMNHIAAIHEGREIHIILDNLNTHKPKNDRWLQRHANIHFHYTPTYSSWMNQVEVWFSILSRRALRGASSTSPRQVREAIDSFVRVYNSKATPFEWTKTVVAPSPRQ